MLVFHDPLSQSKRPCKPYSISNFVDQLTETAIRYGQAKSFFFIYLYVINVLHFIFVDGKSIKAFQAIDKSSSFLLYCYWMCSRIFLDISPHSARLFKCISQGVKPGVHSLTYKKILLSHQRFKNNFSIDEKGTD